MCRPRWPRTKVTLRIDQHLHRALTCPVTSLTFLPACAGISHLNSRVMKEIAMIIELGKASVETKSLNNVPMGSVIDNPPVDGKPFFRGTAA